MSHSPLPNQPTPEIEISGLLANLNARLEYLEGRSRPDSAPLPKVALPDKFDGNISKCRRFISALENIFALQPARYPSDEIKTRFVGTLLTGDALSWFSDISGHFPSKDGASTSYRTFQKLVRVIAI